MIKGMLLLLAVLVGLMALLVTAKMRPAQTSNAPTTMEMRQTLEL